MKKEENDQSDKTYVDLNVSFRFIVKLRYTLLTVTMIISWNTAKK